MRLSTTREALAGPDLPAPPSAGAVASGARRLLDPTKLVVDLWHGRWLILAAAMLFGVVAYAGASQFPKRFTAHGTVVVETDRLAPELQGAVNGTSSHDPLPWVRTEVQVLRAPALMRAVADELELDRSPEFNPALRPPGVLDRALAAVEVWLPVGLPRSGKAREMADWEQRQHVLDTFSDALVITYDNRSLAIDVAFTSRDPELAALAVNTLLRHYLAEKSNARLSTNREANAALTHRVTEVRGEVEDLERQVREARARNSLIQLRAGSVGQQQLEELTAALTRARAARAQSEATFQRASALSRTASATELADFLGTPTISMLREREAEAMRNAAEVTNRYGPGHPDSRRASAELSAVRSHLRDEARRAAAALGAQLEAARQNEAELGRQVAEARDTATRVASLQAELDELQRDADARRALYQALLERAERTAVEPQSGHLLLPGARVMSEAATPGIAGSPRPALAGAIGSLGGVAVGGLLVMLRGSGGRRIARAGELEEMALPTLAVVPRSGRAGGAAGLPGVVLDRLNCPEGEALRLLRGRLRFTSRGGGARVVLFASAQAKEGASALAAAYARVAALDGVRTLLLEGDLRQPSLARLLRAPEGPSLNRVLEGRRGWREGLRQDTATPLDMLLADKPETAAYRLLDSVHLQNLLRDAAEEYNLIVMSGAPVTVASETLMLARQADAAVLVVATGVASQATIRQAGEQLRSASRGLVATVLNMAA